MHGELLPQQAAEAFDLVLSFDIGTYGDASLHRRALDIAGRYRLPAAHDAHYLALAERLGAEFWTADRQLYQAVVGRLAWVNLLGD